MVVCPLVAATASFTLFKSVYSILFLCQSHDSADQINLFRKIKLDAQFDKFVFVLGERERE